MSQRQSLYRKAAYGLAIAILLFPLSWLSSPAVSDSVAPDGKGTSGGKLAQLRTEYQLSQANLGEIDPASETMRLATLGLRGVATNLLWQKALHYKKVEDWTSYSATLEQIANLQPNFINVWKHQAWNLSYNLSVEFDDYRDRYYYVISGIDFLKEGLKYNSDHPTLLQEMGRFISHKIGRADEAKQYRELFKADDDFHPEDRPRDRRDNWLVAREWYLQAEDAVNLKGKPLRKPDGRGKSELLFYSHAPMMLMNYSEAIQNDGNHGEVARQAWSSAGQQWYKYGNLDIPHSTGMRFRLNEREQMLEEAEKARQALDALSPGLREKIVAERRAALSPEKREALEVAEARRTPDEAQLAIQAEAEINVTHRDVVKRIETEAPDKLAEARRLATAAAKAELREQFIKNYREIVNYLYWQMRGQFEQTSEALDARRLAYEAEQALDEAKLIEAQEKFEQSLAQWRVVLDDFPSLSEDAVTGDLLIDVIKEYKQLLSELDEPFPADFPLWVILERFDRDQIFADELEQHRLGTLGKEGEGETAPDATDEKSNSESSDADNADGDLTGDVDETKSDDVSGAESNSVTDAGTT